MLLWYVLKCGRVAGLERLAELGGGDPTGDGAPAAREDGPEEQPARAEERSDGPGQRQATRTTGRLRVEDARMTWSLALSGVIGWLGNRHRPGRLGRAPVQPSPSAGWSRRHGNVLCTAGWSPARLPFGTGLCLGDDVDCDTEGDARHPADPAWTDLYAQNRSRPEETFDVIPACEAPLTLEVRSPIQWLAAAVVYLLAAETAGRVATDPRKPFTLASTLRCRTGNFDMEAAWGAIQG